MRSILAKIFRNDITLLLWRMVIVYVALLLLRIVFYAYNADTLGTLAWSEVPQLLRGGWIFDNANVGYCYGLFIVLSLLPLRVRGRVWYQRMLLWMWSVVSSAVVLINTMDCVYFHFAKKRISAQEFFFAENGNTSQILLKSAAENWYLSLMVILLSVAMIWMYRRVRYAPLAIKSNVGYRILSTIALVAAVLLIVIGIRGGIGRAIRPITLSNAAHFAATPTKASVVLSNPFCIIRTLGNKKLRYVKYFSDSSLMATYYSPEHAPSYAHAKSDSAQRDLALASPASVQRYPAPGSQRGKNIMIFVLESFSYEHSAYLNPDLYNGEVSYTPFLDSLMQQGYLFRRGYANGRKSIDALPSVLSSIPSFKDPFVLMPQALGETRGLGTLLGEDGYSTWFFNGSEERSMGFVAYARTSGIANARTRENYQAARGNGDFDNYWGIWDAPFMQYMARELDSAPKPFFSTIFTLSSHHPFVVPDAYESRLPEGRTKIQRPVAYTDMAIREFFDYARTQSWFDSTVFLFVADHVSSELYGEQSATPTGNSHIIYFMYTPDGSLRGDDGRVTQQIDIMPTLLGLVGYAKPYFAYGRDVFNETPTDGFAINYLNESFQWINDSTVMFFNERDVTNMFDSPLVDPLQRRELLGQGHAADTSALLRMKAMLQSYYQHLERANYTIGK